MLIFLPVGKRGRRCHRGSCSADALACRLDARNRKAEGSEQDAFGFDFTCAEDPATGSDQFPNGEVSQASLPSCGLRREPTPHAADAASLLRANVPSYKNKIADLFKVIERSSFPTYLVFIETWLGLSFESSSIPGYILISRRNRGSSAHGGVILFAKFGYVNIMNAFGKF